MVLVPWDGARHRMRDLAPHARLYLILVVVAGYLAMVRMLWPAPVFFGSKWVVLLLLAAACGPLKFHLGRRNRNRGVSFGLVFVFAALIDIEEPLTALIAMAAAAGELTFSNRQTRLKDWLFTLASTNVSLAAAYEAFRGFQALEAGSVGSMALAGVVFFAAHSWAHAAGEALEGGRPVWGTWRQEFLPRSPAVVGMALCGAAVSRLCEPSYLNTFVLALPVLCLSYYCYEFYFGRLRSERQHAQEISDMYRRTVAALVLAIDAKDRITAGHVLRVQRFALAIGRRLGCSDDEMKALEIGALLHDLGKIGVPEQLLSKPTRLTREEFKQVAAHPQLGAEILDAVNFPFPVTDTVLYHHENWDGSGYPAGLKGEEIPLTARILSVADRFDAMTSERPYRPPFTREEAVEMMKSCRGSLFDPVVLDALLAVLPEVDSIVDTTPPLVLRSPRRIEAVQMRHTESKARPEGADEAEVVSATLAEVGRVLDYDASAVYLLNGDGLQSVYCSWGPAKPLHVALDGPTGRVASRGGTLVHSHPSAEQGELGMEARSRGWRDALIAPLWARGRVIGVVSLYATRPGVYTAENARCLELMTAKLGIALERAAVVRAVALAAGSF